MQQTAVVTGAGRGLGRLVARGLADKGLAVLVTDIDERSAHDTAKWLGGAAWAMAQDVRDPASHRRVAEAARERGEVAVWVNNAGVLRSRAAWEHPDEETRLQIEVNVLGVMWGSKAAVEVMQHQGGNGSGKPGHGHIINIASISSIVPVPGLAVYAASKHAVLGYSISLQGDLEHAGLGIKVSAVCPDAIDTDMTRAVRGDHDAALLFSSGKLLTADEVAAVVVGLVDNPRLVVVRPRVRALLAHIVRPFPETGLRVLKQFRRLGERNQRKAGAID